MACQVWWCSYWVIKASFVRNVGCIFAQLFTLVDSFKMPYGQEMVFTMHMCCSMERESVCVYVCVFVCVCVYVCVISRLFGHVPSESQQVQAWHHMIYLAMTFFCSPLFHDTWHSGSCNLPIVMTSFHSPFVTWHILWDCTSDIVIHLHTNRSWYW